MQSAMRVICSAWGGHVALAVASTRRGTLLLRTRGPKYARLGLECNKTVAPSTSLIRCLSDTTKSHGKGHNDGSGSSIVKFNEKKRSFSH